MRAILFLVLSLAACVGCESKTFEKVTPELTPLITSEVPSEKTALRHVTSDGVVLSDPEDFESSYSIAIREEDYELAESIARKMVDDDPDDASAWIMLTYPLMLTGRRKAAMEACNKALAIAPSNTRLHYTRGFIEQEQGDACLDREEYDSANQHFNAAVRNYTRTTGLDPDFPDPHVGLAAAYEGLGYEKVGYDALVIQLAKRYLELDPNSPRKDDALDMIRMATYRMNK